MEGNTEMQGGNLELNAAIINFVARVNAGWQDTAINDK